MNTKRPRTLTDEEIIDLLQHLDKCLSNTWPRAMDNPYEKSATHERVLYMIKTLKQPKVMTIVEGAQNAC